MISRYVSRRVRFHSREAYLTGLALGKRYSSTHQKKFKNEAMEYEFIRNDRFGPTISNKSDLPFQDIRNSETFGQLVRSDRLEKNGELNDTSRVVKKTFEHDEAMNDSPYRNADGEFIKGSNAEEARIHDSTLYGRVDRSVTKIPIEIATTINNNILRLTYPDKLRERAAKIFQSLNKEQIQKAPESSIDCDAHIAALFIQDYSNVRQVLLELQKRIGANNFQPKRVLDVGYGPSTGMIALNEVMGDEFLPEVKDSYIVGARNHEMKKRAKIILSRQLCEQPNDGDTSDLETKVSQKVNDDIEEIFTAEEQTEQWIPEEQDESEDVSENDYIGPVDTSRIHIRTKLRDSLPVTKQYDLIMVNQALLSREYNFPKDIDVNLHMILRLLSPGGKLVLVERGNALGFETIARARQVMIRPESYGAESGKVPRPYIKGSKYKPQKIYKPDLIVTEDASRTDEIMEEEGLKFEEELNKAYGEVSSEDLAFEFENNDSFEIVSAEDQESRMGSNSVDYHLSIIAPCPHHGKCPLQLGDPKYYKIPLHKHRLSFCSFNKSVERPKFTMELKKGVRLSSHWNTFSEDGFGLDSISKKERKRLEGSGRPGGNNIESGTYSYLIAERSFNDLETIKNIAQERDFNLSEDEENQNPLHWPRIVENPAKMKNNVRLTVCSPRANIETWQVPKSLGKQTYYDARKAGKGDLWALGKKSVTTKNKISDEVIEKLDLLAKTTKKKFLKEERKKQAKKIISASEHDFEDPSMKLADELATSLENSKRYKSKGKRAKYDVDLKEYEGK